MDWQNILIFGIIPILTVIILFFTKRKLLWLSPFVSTILAFIAYMVILAQSMESPIIKIIGNNEWRAFFFLALLIHFVITVVVTVIAYLISYILKRNESKNYKL